MLGHGGPQPALQPGHPSERSRYLVHGARPVDRTPPPPPPPRTRVHAERELGEGWLSSAGVASNAQAGRGLEKG